MPSITLEDRLEQLDEAKLEFGTAACRKILAHLRIMRRRRITSAESLIRYHEILLFLLAYAQSAELLRLAEQELSSFALRVSNLIEEGADLSSLEHPEVSGVAGMSVSDTFSYYIVRWLVAHYSNEIMLNWEWFDQQNRIAEAWPRFMPLLEEDALVEANVPYERWLSASRGKEREVSWLVRQFDSLKMSDKQKAELYDAQQLYVTWTPSYQATRTGMRLPPAKIFYHRGPLIQRREISFRAELERAPVPLKSLSRKEGERVLDLARETSTIRYRELHGFTHGDPNSLLRAEIGRGVDLYINGVAREQRLPLRAYHSAMIFKNGIAVGYFEGLSLAERMESGFNFYYTFREGETAWIYTRTLNVFRHLLNVTSFSIDPYQVGHENEEGIESGAFWFYRKLGFRSTNRAVQGLTEKEEQKIAARKSYRTSAKTLRQLAVSSMIFELDQSKAGDWDNFQVRKIGLAVQRKMASSGSGDAVRFREMARDKLCESLRIKQRTFSEDQAFSDFAVVLSLVADLDRWSPAEKKGVLEIIKAKVGDDEIRYLKLMQSHQRLRNEIIRLGSKDI